MSEKILNMLGNELINSDGAKVHTNTLCGKQKVIGLYFAASWCPPCKDFTSKLKQLYNALRNRQVNHAIENHNHVGIEFEIVYISWDKSESEYIQSFSVMSWIGLPFKDRDRKVKLSRKFRIHGIPQLVLVDGETGKTVTTDGFSQVQDDPQGIGFPWRRKHFLDLIHGMRCQRQAQEEEAESVLKGKVVGLYFAANWCPPCKFFTPLLMKTYECLRESGYDFEVVFVSSDRSLDSYEQHVSSMPWLVVPFSDVRLQELAQHFNVDSIPNLIFLDAQGNTINTNGRHVILQDPTGINFPWYPLPIKELTHSAAVQLNENACLILFTARLFAFTLGGAYAHLFSSIGVDVLYIIPFSIKETSYMDIHDGKEEEILEAKAVLKLEATKESEKGDEQELYFFYAVGDDFSNQVKTFAGLGNRSPMLVILDSPSQHLYISHASDMSCELVTEFVEGYFSGTLTPVCLRHNTVNYQDSEN